MPKTSRNPVRAKHTDDTGLRLQSFSVTKLFGRFNHHVAFPFDSNIVIIIAPNGFGKTAILKLINAIFNLQFRKISSTVFEQIRLEFDNGDALTIHRNPDAELFQNAPAKGSEFRQLFFAGSIAGQLHEWQYTAKKPAPPLLVSI